MPSWSGRLTVALRESDSRATLRSSVPEVCPDAPHLLSSSLFIITELACVAEQRKHSTVDRASLMDFVGASPTAGMKD